MAYKIFFYFFLLFSCGVSHSIQRGCFGFLEGLFEGLFGGWYLSRTEGKTPSHRNFCSKENGHKLDNYHTANLPTTIHFYVISSGDSIKENLKNTTSKERAATRIIPFANSENTSGSSKNKYIPITKAEIGKII
jgi:hypothetical protein